MTCAIPAGAIYRHLAVTTKPVSLEAMANRYAKAELKANTQ